MNIITRASLTPPTIEIVGGVNSETIKDKVISTWAIAPRKLCNDVEEFLAENCADYSKYRSDIPMKAVSRIESGRKVLWKNPIFEETKK